MRRWDFMRAEREDSASISRRRLSRQLPLFSGAPTVGHHIREQVFASIWWNVIRAEGLLGMRIGYLASAPDFVPRASPPVLASCASLLVYSFELLVGYQARRFSREGRSSILTI